MASMSLPRVLQQRKSSLEIERENFEKCQAIAITKAINHIESPLKQKHVRSAIIGTFQEKNARTFWLVVLKLPLLEDRIVAWKFCHVLHKLMREGHPSVLIESNKHCDQLKNLGKLWVHLQDCYGKLIQLYSNLILSKLEFHKRNPRIPGNLSLTSDELENIGENDINNYFQICVEIFDYMDNILELQNAIFGSIDRSRSNSMTTSGQCRLSPLIPCIQDASRLYDLSVKILFKLHFNLPPDVLVGHRDRFMKQFKELKQFYQLANTLQYFKNLITIPVLPDSPPNFLIHSELHTYVTPVVIIPPEESENDTTEAHLVDTTDAQESIDQEHYAYLTRLLADREKFIYELQQENRALSLEIQRVTKEHKKIIDSFQHQLNILETDLATSKSELIQERQLKEDLLHEVSSSTQCLDTEQKLKEEKFHKLKEVYTKLREEHISLIRQKAETEKKLHVIQRENADMESRIQQSENKVKELSVEQTVKMENLQKACEDKLTELQEEQCKILKLSSESEALKNIIFELQNNKTNFESKVKKVAAENIELVKVNEDLETSIKGLNESLSTLKILHETESTNIFDNFISESEQMIQKTLNEVDHPVIPTATTCTPEYLCSLTQNALDLLQLTFTIYETKLIERCITMSKLGHVFAIYIFQGNATSNSSPNIIFGEQLTEKCKNLGQNILLILQGLRNKQDVKVHLEKSIEELKTINELSETLSKQLQTNNSDILADLVESELTAMDKAIEEAAKKIQELLNNSRAADSGVKLEVNEKILDSCTNLILAIKLLVKNSRSLQEEIVSQGKGSVSLKEFYKRNHRWSEGFISAAKAVGSGAGYLLNAANKVIIGEGKLEQIIVAAQEIAASTAQLVVASRVKADRNSKNLKELSLTSRKVTNATGEVVATVKNCNEIIEEADEFDASKLTLHMAKRLEMDMQVKILEMEKELEQNRYKLSALRRQHYKLAGENEGWENDE